MSLPHSNEAGPNFQFSSLQESDRIDIVDLSSNFNLDGAAYMPFSRFDLTALGADVDLDGKWDVQGYDLSEWHHIATTGRDQYVKVVKRGWLFPFGHRAVIINVVERILVEDPAEQASWSDAVLRQQQFIRVLQPVKEFPAYGALYTNDWPFTQVEMKTIVTPPLSTTNISLKPAGETTAQLIKTETVQGASTVDLQWAYILTDAAGNQTHASGPLAFCYAQDVNGYINEFDSNLVAPLALAYNGLPTSERTINAGGGPIKYAPEGNGQLGSTSHPTYSLVMSAATCSLDPVTDDATGIENNPTTAFQQGQPAFYPVMSQALVRLPAAEGLSRGQFNDSSGKGINIQYYPDYVRHGLVNAGSVYMELSDAVMNKPPQLSFPADAVGGIGTPNIQVTGLSSTAGTVSGPLSQYATAGSLSPLDYFPGLTGNDTPQLLGGLTLGQILGAFKNEFGMPTIVNQINQATGERTVTYTMVAALSAYPNAADPIFDPDTGDGTMTLTAVINISPSGQSTYNVTGTITPFTVNIIGTSGGLNFIQIPFQSAVFTSASGKKPDVKVKMGQITFQGALTFVNTLEQFLEDLGGSGFQVTVTPSQISAGFSISLPDISIGMLDLSGLGISASVVVPFAGSPALATFSFASKENPFTVAVSMFGGGGFVTLVLGLQSVQQVSCGIDFQGNFELNIYIASGGISLTAGIYFNYTAGVGVQLTGYVKLWGGIEALGMFSVSIELDLSLTYQEDPSGNSYVSGSATLTISVHIIFFSIDFGFTVHKQFSGSGKAPPAQDPTIVMRGSGQQAALNAPGRRAFEANDQPLYSFTDPVASPAFSDFIPDPTTWSNYCGAYAG